MTTVETLMNQFAVQFRQIMNQPCLYDFVLDRGRAMQIEPLTVKEARHIAMLAKPRGGVNSFRSKECYMNAQKLRLEDFTRSGGIEYCEGYVAWEGAPLAISHAWVTLNGKVVDVTLRALSKTKLHSYFGVVVPLKALMANMRETETYSPVIEGPLQHLVFPKMQSAKRVRG